MREVADDVFHLPLAPRSAVNAYLLGDVLVDAGMPWQAGRVLSQVRGRTVREHVLTHAHPDHAGGSRRVVDALGVPVRAGARDLPALHAGAAENVASSGAVGAVARRVLGFAALPEAAPLQEGDVVGPGFAVLDTPGHSPGHVSLWREADGVLVCGDVVLTMDLTTTRPGLREPPEILTPDPAQNRDAIRRLSELRPRLVLAGHGAPLKQAQDRLLAFGAGLPTS